MQQGQRAVQAAGEDNADGQVRIEPDPDAVLQCGPHQPRGLVDVGNELVAVPHSEQVHIRGDSRVVGRARPSVVAGRDLADGAACGDKRLQFRGHVQVAAAA